MSTVPSGWEHVDRSRSSMSMAWPQVFDIDISKLDPNATQPVTPPTIILGHDAFHTADHLQHVARLIGGVGYRALRAQLPSSNHSYFTAALEADVQALFECCRPDLEGGRDVIMVLHGYAAIPGAIAAERLNRHSLGVPRAGEVVKLILVAGIVLQENESYTSLLKPEWIAFEGSLCHVSNPSQVLFHDCDIGTARSAEEVLRPQVVDSLHSCASARIWSAVPTVYVLCQLDRATPPQLQHMFAARLQSANRRSQVVQIQTGHSPFLANPEELTAIITRAVSG